MGDRRKNYDAAKTIPNVHHGIGLIVNIVILSRYFVQVALISIMSIKQKPLGCTSAISYIFVHCVKCQNSLTKAAHKCRGQPTLSQVLTDGRTDK